MPRPPPCPWSSPPSPSPTSAQPPFEAPPPCRIKLRPPPRPPSAPDPPSLAALRSSTSRRPQARARSRSSSSPPPYPVHLGLLTSLAPASCMPAAIDSSKTLSPAHPHTALPPLLLSCSRHSAIALHAISVGVATSCTTPGLLPASSRPTPVGSTLLLPRDARPVAPSPPTRHTSMSSYTLPPATSCCRGRNLPEQEHFGSPSEIAKTYPQIRQVWLHDLPDDHKFPCHERLQRRETRHRQVPLPSPCTTSSTMTHEHLHRIEPVRLTRTLQSFWVVIRSAWIRSTTLYSTTLRGFDLLQSGIPDADT